MIVYIRVVIQSIYIFGRTGKKKWMGYGKISLYIAAQKGALGQILASITVSITASHAVDQGSTPWRGTPF